MLAVAITLILVWLIAVALMEVTYWAIHLLFWLAIVILAVWLVQRFIGRGRDGGVY